MTLVIWTYDWVPDGPRGHVRDIRLRWAAEEAGLDHEIRTVTHEEKGLPDWLARQPFAQVPALEDGDVRLFESGACLLHIAEKSETLLPAEPVARAETLSWLFAALSSVEMLTVPRWYMALRAEETPLDSWHEGRLDRLEAAVAGRDWLAAGRFTAADILMADVLRLPKKQGHLDARPALSAYVERATARPAFRRAYEGQMALYAD